LFKNIGEKPAFQNGWFSERLVFRKAGFQKGWFSERLVFRKAGFQKGWFPATFSLTFKDTVSGLGPSLNKLAGVNS
jgi:hypothetical protein